MYDPPGLILAQWLVDQGLATAPEDAEDWTVYVNFMPTQGDRVIMIWGGGGRAHSKVRAGARAVHPSIQIWVRAEDDPTAVDKAMEINNALDSLVRAQVTVGANTYLIQNVMRMHEPMSMGEEEEGGREVYLTNCSMSYHTL